MMFIWCLTMQNDVEKGKTIWYTKKAESLIIQYIRGWWKMIQKDSVSSQRDNIILLESFVLQGFQRIASWKWCLFDV